MLSSPGAQAYATHVLALCGGGPIVKTLAVLLLLLLSDSMQHPSDLACNTQLELPSRAMNAGRLKPLRSERL